MECKKRAYPATLMKIDEVKSGKFNNLYILKIRHCHHKGSKKKRMGGNDVTEIVRMQSPSSDASLSLKYQCSL